MNFQNQKNYHLNAYNIQFTNTSCSPSMSCANNFALEENLMHLNELLSQRKLMLESQENELKETVKTGKKIEQPRDLPIKPKEVYLNVEKYKKPTKRVQQDEKENKESYENRNFKYFYQKRKEKVKQNSMSRLETKSEVLKRNSSLKGSLLSLNVIERNQKFIENRDEKLRRKSQEKIDNELKKCTFKPIINKTSPNSFISFSSFRKDSKTYGQIFNDKRTVFTERSSNFE